MKQLIRLIPERFARALPLDQRNFWPQQLLNPLHANEEPVDGPPQAAGESVAQHQSANRSPIRRLLPSPRPFVPVRGGAPRPTVPVRDCCICAEHRLPGPPSREEKAPAWAAGRRCRPLVQIIIAAIVHDLDQVVFFIRIHERVDLWPDPIAICSCSGSRSCERRSCRTARLFNVTSRLTAAPRLAMSCSSAVAVRACSKLSQSAMPQQSTITRRQGISVASNTRVG